MHWHDDVPHLITAASLPSAAEGDSQQTEKSRTNERTTERSILQSKLTTSIQRLLPPPRAFLPFNPLRRHEYRYFHMDTNLLCHYSFSRLYMRSSSSHFLIIRTRTLMIRAYRHSAILCRSSAPNSCIISPRRSPSGHSSRSHTTNFDAALS